MKIIDELMIKWKEAYPHNIFSYVENDRSKTSYGYDIYLNGHFIQYFIFTRRDSTELREDTWIILVDYMLRYLTYI